MDIAWWIIAIVVALVLLFLVVKFIQNCLPKIVIGLIILAVLAFIIIRFIIQ